MRLITDDQHLTLKKLTPSLVNQPVFFRIAHARDETIVKTYII